MDQFVDRWLGRLARQATRRARGGQPVWMVLAGSLWLARRWRRQRGAVLWHGKVGAGETLSVTVRDPHRPPQS